MGNKKLAKKIKCHSLWFPEIDLSNVTCRDYRKTCSEKYSLWNFCNILRKYSSWNTWFLSSCAQFEAEISIKLFWQTFLRGDMTFQVWSYVITQDKCLIVTSSSLELNSPLSNADSLSLSMPVLQDDTLEYQKPSYCGFIR